MRILLISEQEADFGLVDRLLKDIDGEKQELSWSNTDAIALAEIKIKQFQLVIWGEIADQHVASRLLSELYRQHAAIPVIVLTDVASKATPLAEKSDNLNVDEKKPSAARSMDVLLRTELTAETLQNSIEFVTSKLTSSELISADPLTGLNNRQQFREQLAAVLKAAKKPNSIALLLIDIDQFKKVNASYGQGAGDALIQLIAERIRACLSPYQQLARIGGNEFAVVFQNASVSVETESRLRVERIIESMAKPFPVAQHAVRMNVSIGLVLNGEPGISVDSMLANADMAMRIAKQEKGSNYQLFTKDMTDAAQKILKLETEIRQGIRKEEFELYYQPRVDIINNRIVGMEALIRWRHPTRGLLPPAEFIAVAEESGLIVPLGYWIIHSACKHLNDLSSKGFTDVQIAVNVAFKQFQDKKFVQTVANIIEKHGISPGRLEFELTETTMMIEGQAVDQSLRELSELGIDISLDDFGTGYSSFAHIQRLPISALKIDRCFVSSVSTNEDDATIVRAIINLAHSLSMQVIAEGAETIEQVEFLCLNKCDQVQGYYFSKAVSYNEIKVLLNREGFVDEHIQAIISRNRTSV